MLKTKAVALCGLMLIALSCQREQEAVAESDQTPTPAPTPNPDCSWCGATEAPSDVSWTTQIAPPSEPGERLSVTGTVYQSDGTTPAPDVTLYVYHTNIQGEYPKRGDETGNGVRHGYLRGWVKSDSKGRYQFDTIRPAPYPTHEGEPAHIHYTVLPKGGEEYWLSSAWFSDDPLVTDELVAGLDRVGGFPNVMEMSRDENGVWHGVRNLVIEKY